MSTEREAAMLEAAEKFEELRGDGNELYGWFRGQVRGKSGTLLWAEMTMRRRRTMPESTLDEPTIRARVRATQAVLAPSCCGCGDCPPPPSTIDAETAQLLCRDIEAALTEVARLRESESRAVQAADAQEKWTAHVRDRVLEFFRRCVAPNEKRGTIELRPYGITQFSIEPTIVNQTRGDAIWYALEKWWRQLVEPQEFPENHKLPDGRVA